MEGKRGNYIALAVTLSALGALLLCSQAALESARAGLTLCAQMIVPSLLPFFILSSLLQQLGLPGILGRWLSPVTQKLFGIGGAANISLRLGEGKADKAEPQSDSLRAAVALAESREAAARDELRAAVTREQAALKELEALRSAPAAASAKSAHDRALLQIADRIEALATKVEQIS